MKSGILEIFSKKSIKCTYHTSHITLLTSFVTFILSAMTSTVPAIVVCWSILYSVLKAVGYPFEFEMMENSLEITDEGLFEQYARDQWLGMEVNSETYLFDQKIIPDFAFKVISAEPENSIISENTKIQIIVDEKNKKIRFN